MPVLSHRRLEAAAVPGVQWLPLPLAPSPEPADVAAQFLAANGLNK